MAHKANTKYVMEAPSVSLSHKFKTQLSARNVRLSVLGLHVEDVVTCCEMN
jgi:hypothetical protein